MIFNPPSNEWYFSLWISSYFLICCSALSSHYLSFSLLLVITLVSGTTSSSLFRLAQLAWLGNLTFMDKVTSRWSFWHSYIPWGLLDPEELTISCCTIGKLALTDLTIPRPLLAHPFNLFAGGSITCFLMVPTLRSLLLA